MPKNDSDDKLLIFQDFDLSKKDGDDNDVSEIFFELANSPFVGYAINKNQNNVNVNESVQKKNKKNNRSSSSDSGSDNDSDSDDSDESSSTSSNTTTTSRTIIKIKQDITACGEHTGGIVWETSYLLLQYLQHLHNGKEGSMGSTLELGAGCGMLGQCLYRLQLCRDTMIMTETNQVMSNLISNVERNKVTMKNSQCKLRTCTLDWNTYKEDCSKSNIEAHSMDTIIGTDVIFTPTLVKPLLETIKYLSHSNTVTYLCLQERCKDSHAILLKETSRKGSKGNDIRNDCSKEIILEDITNDVTSIPECSWGSTMDCYVFKLTMKNNSRNTNQKDMNRKDNDDDNTNSSTKKTESKKKGKKMKKKHKQQKRRRVD